MKVSSTQEPWGGYVLAASLLLAPAPGTAQEPVGWGDDPFFSTFSIAAVDPRSGESGVAVTTRNACVGAAVPWVRAGVGAVATQAWSRIEYGDELLDRLERGMSPEEALERGLAADSMAERRQLGVMAVDGRSAQHTGSGTSAWAGHRAGPSYVTQGNILVGPGVLEAVARSFEASEDSPRHLADRLIEAMAAGQRAGGDSRHGRMQSAAVMVADPRPGMASRPDGRTVNIQICEHPEPVGEMRRVYDAISETLGFRVLQQEVGNDVVQLKMMLHALGYFEPERAEISGDDRNAYTQAAVDAVDAFRQAQGWRTTVPGYVDAATIEGLWRELEAAGKADELRRRLLDLQRVRR